MSDDNKPWPTAKDLDKQGMVRCYDNEKGEYIRMYPVDVREGIKAGTISKTPKKSEESDSVDSKKDSVTIEDINKANKSTLQKILKDAGKEVDGFDDIEKLEDKRAAVIEALGLKAE